MTVAGTITCWCGAQGTYDEVFNDSGRPSGPCGGSGHVDCNCGGDQCVCHHHGVTDCPGCEDCEPDDDYWDDDDEE